MTRIMTGIMHATAAVVLAVAVAGCGDNRSEPGEPPDASAPTEAAPPSVTIAFPPSGSLTDADTALIRGTAQDASEIAAITAGGASATSDDGFATWQLEVPLAHGTNAIAIEARDIHGNVDPAAAALDVVRSELIDDLREVVVADADRAFAIGFDTSEVYGLDRVSGAYHLISGIRRGAGSMWFHASGMAWDSTGERLLISDASGNAMWSVDVATGDRAVVSNSTRGTGVALDRPAGVAVAAGGATLYVSMRSSVVAVDVATGDRTLVSGATRGAGDPIVGGSSVLLDPGGGRLLVLSGEYAIVAVELTTGDRTVVSSDSVGAGPAFECATRMTGDVASGIVWVGDICTQVLFRVDLATGERTIAARGSIEDGWMSPTSLGVDLATGQVLMTSWLTPFMLGYDPATGIMSRADNAAAGSGAALLGVSHAEFATLDGQLHALLALRVRMEDEDTLGTIVAANLITGERSVWMGHDDLPTTDLMPKSLHVASEAGLAWLILTRSDHVAGPFQIDLATRQIEQIRYDHLDDPSAVAYDSVLDQVLIQGGNALIGVVPDADEPGEHHSTLLSGSKEDRGGGAPLYSACAIAFEASAGRVFTCQYDQITEIDLTTGYRSLVPVGVALERMSDLHYDAVGQSLVIADRGDLPAIIEHRVDTGETRVVTGRGTGGGASLIEPTAVDRDPSQAWLYYLDTGTSGLAVVDPVTGHRVIIAR